MGDCAQLVGMCKEPVILAPYLAAAMNVARPDTDKCHSRRHICERSGSFASLHATLVTQHPEAKPALVHALAAGLCLISLHTFQFGDLVLFCALGIANHTLQLPTPRPVRHFSIFVWKGVLLHGVWGFPLAARTFTIGYKTNCKGYKRILETKEPSCQGCRPGNSKPFGSSDSVGSCGVKPEKNVVVIAYQYRRAGPSRREHCFCSRLCFLVSSGSLIGCTVRSSEIRLQWNVVR